MSLEVMTCIEHRRRSCVVCTQRSGASNIPRRKLGCFHATCSIINLLPSFFFNDSSSPFRAQASLQFCNPFSQTVGLLRRVISPPQGRYPNTEQRKHRINAYTHQISMPWVGFEPTIPASERAKTIPLTARLLWPAIFYLSTFPLRM
jgi:hypothetical protein